MSLTRRIGGGSNTNTKIIVKPKTSKTVRVDKIDPDPDFDDSECESIDIENLGQILVNVDIVSEEEIIIKPTKLKMVKPKTIKPKTIKPKTVKPKKQPVKSQPKNKRTVMFLDDDPAKPVTAGGVIIYKYVKGKMMLLIIETDGKYEDIGGKIDPDDSDVFSAVAREVQEETNEQIMSEDILDRLKIASYVYVPRSKYVVYIVEATVQEKKLKKTDFGEMEEHDAFPRTIGWIARDALMKPQTIQYKMNWRLKSKELFDKLIDIEKDGMFKKKIFKKPIDDDDDDDDADEQ